MAFVELEIVRSGSSECIVQALPDGSTAIFEVATKNVYSLNPSAAAAWEACVSATTLSRLATAMSRRLNRPVTEDLAHEAVSELVAVGLVSVTPAEQLGTSRRAMLKQVAGVALPVVLVLTGAEQRAHAQANGSNPITITTQPGTTAPGPVLSTTQGSLPIGIDKAVAPSFDAVEGRVPLGGVEFDVLDAATNQVVAHFKTDAAGHGTVNLTPGVTYILVETFAPPELAAYEPFPPFQFKMNDQINGFDLNNVLKPA
jgi:hypothetical protein